MSPKPPNILLILTDQHRLSAVGCYGPTPCQTPNIDRLAEEGVRFAQAYTACPVCSPARATIMTGLYPHAHGVCCNVEDLGSSVHELADRSSLLPRQLQIAGYNCGFTGKWHLGTGLREAYGAANVGSLPCDIGFEGHNFPGHGNGGFGYPEYQQYLAEHGYHHETYQVHPGLGARRFEVLKGPVESTIDYFLAEHTISLIDRFAEAGQPFFISHNFWGPHSPYLAPREFYDLYADVEIPEWSNCRWEARAINGPHQAKIHPNAERLTWEDWAEGIRHYYAFTTLIDQQIGRIIDHLRRTGLLDETVIVMAADHGETLGSHGGLTDKGFHHFEEIQRIPLIVRPPAADLGGPAPAGAGACPDELVSLVDLYPTLLDFAGVECPAGAVHGRSLRPLIEGRAAAWRESVFVEFFGLNSVAATMLTVRRHDLKYGWNCSTWDELYDLSTDPDETTNLIHDGRYAEAVQVMRQLLLDFMLDTGFPGGAVSVYKRSRLGIEP